jgi:myosin-crossreactive antigen
MMERMQVEMKTNQERLEAKTEVEIKTNHEEMKVNQEKPEALQAEIKTHQERMEAVTDTNTEKFEVLQENMWIMWQGMEARMEA